jgi:hypothetical protein
MNDFPIAATDSLRGSPQNQVPTPSDEYPTLLVQAHQHTLLPHGSHLHRHSLHTLALRGRIAPRLLQRQRTAIPILPELPPRVLPLLSAQKLSGREGSEEGGSQDHHASLEDHEGYLVVCEFAVEAVS